MCSAAARRHGVGLHSSRLQGVGRHGAGRHGVGRRRRAPPDSATSLIAILKAFSLAQVLAQKEVRQMRHIKGKESLKFIFPIFKLKKGRQILNYLRYCADVILIEMTCNPLPLPCSVLQFLLLFFSLRHQHLATFVPVDISPPTTTTVSGKQKRLMQ